MPTVIQVIIGLLIVVMALGVFGAVRRMSAKSEREGDSGGAAGGGPAV